MSQPLIAALKRLMNAHPDSIAASTMTTAQKRQLDEFCRKTHSVRMTPSGRGVAYRIEDLAVVTVTLQQLSPHQDLPLSIPPRAANIASTRSSKQGRITHDVTHVFIKTQAQPNWYDRDRPTEQLQRASEEFGVAALEIGGDKNHSLYSKHPIWLVENQELFDRLDWLPTSEPTSVIWYRGQLHNKLIDWLAAPQRSPFIYLFADYDGVGLNNYRRLKERLGERATFWLMPNWRTLLTRYGQNKLWIDTAREFESFERNSQRLLAQSPLLGELVTEMKKHGLALEQEVIWLQANSPSANFTSSM
ncbi:Wadjet anti-phage system protein JetD domain-containing protein [Vibrio vulnificus]